MFGSGVNLELSIHGATERIVRQHAFYGDFQGAGRRSVDQLLEANAFDTTGEFRMAVIDFVGGFFAGYLNLLGIDDDDVIAGIYVRSKFGLVFAAQTQSDFGGQTTERLARCIDQIPVALYSVGFCTEGF